MTTQMFYTPDVSTLATNPKSWLMAEDAVTYLCSDWNGKGARPNRDGMQEVSPAQLEALDTRLPVLFQEIFKRPLDAAKRGTLLAQTCRFWLNQNPMPFGKPFYNNAFIDRVELIQVVDRERENIRLKALAVELDTIKGVQIVKKATLMTTAVPFSDVEPYYPHFLKRLDVAVGLNMSIEEEAGYIFPQSPAVNALFLKTDAPELPDMG